jgi:SNF2 family DNA or RNA helicase
MKILSQYVLHRGEEEVLKLPEIRYSVHVHEMEEDQKEIYDSMEKNMIASLSRTWTDISDSSISVDVVIAQITRLRQISISPSLVLPEYQGSDKIDSLVNLIHDNVDEKNIVVFTSFSSAAKLIEERLEVAGILAETISGDVPRYKRDDLVRDFGKSFHVLILTHGTGGESLTLVQATMAIFLDLAWHPAGNKHAAKRIHRIGQDHNVDIVYLKSNCRIEDYMQEIIEKKGRMTSNDLIKRIKEELWPRSNQQHQPPGANDLPLSALLSSTPYLVDSRGF